MPQLGDIHKYGSHKDIWQACVDCGKERWVRLRNGQPCSIRCQHCGGGVVGRIRKKNGVKQSNGYRYVLLEASDDFFKPMAEKSGYILEHRLIVAKLLGRCLHRWEWVHHRNGIRNDNRIENLELIVGAHNGRVKCPFCGKEFGIH